MRALGVTLAASVYSETNDYVILIFYFKNAYMNCLKPPSLMPNKIYWNLWHTFNTEVRQLDRYLKYKYVITENQSKSNREEFPWGYAKVNW